MLFSRFLYNFVGGPKVNEKAGLEFPVRFRFLKIRFRLFLEEKFGFFGFYGF